MHKYTATCIFHCEDHAEYVDIGCSAFCTLSDAVNACHTEVAPMALHGSMAQEEQQERNAWDQPKMQ